MRQPDFKPHAYKLTCSCGKKTILIQKDWDVPFKPADSNWKLGRGNIWYCGKKGHTLKDSFELEL